MKYKFRGTLTVSCWTKVEADSKEEALKIAESREVAHLCWGALYPDQYEAWQFENDGEPENIKTD